MKSTIQRKKWIDFVKDVLCRITNSGENAIISNEYKHYLAGKISTLLRKNLKYNENFHSLNCLNSFRSKTKLESHKTFDITIIISII